MMDNATIYRTSKNLSDEIDAIRIEKAHKEFKRKCFYECANLYNTVENKNLLAEIDKKVIEYCEQQLLKKH